MSYRSIVEKFWSMMKAVECTGQRQYHDSPPEELLTDNCSERCHSRKDVDRGKGSFVTYKCFCVCYQ
jgi:hypothetical protein